jgi:hypothetical protein
MKMDISASKCKEGFQYYEELLREKVGINWRILQGWPMPQAN